MPVTLPYLQLVLCQCYTTEEGEKVWLVSARKAWEVVRRVSDGWIYPHAFRLIRATLMTRTLVISISDMKAHFGWALSSTADA